MKLSFSTNAYVRYSVFEAVERIASIGYAGVEILADVPHLYAPNVSDSDLTRLKDLLNRKGLQVANVNANTAAGYYGREFWEPLFEPSLAHPEASGRRWRIDYSKKCIDMARVLGARNISITSGRMVPGSDPEMSMELFRESLREVLGHAEECGVGVGIEYEPGLLIERYEELAALLREIDTPSLGANLDLGHSHVLGEDAERVVRGLSPKVLHIHLEDIRAGKHFHLIPGMGDINFGALFHILKNHAYDGFVTVELYTYPHRPDEAAQQSLRYLEPFLNR